MKKRMFVTVRRYEGVPNPVNAAREVDEKFVPFISSLHGFVEYYWIDLSGNSMISITVFKTLGDAIAANEKARAWVRENLPAVLPNAPRTEAGIIVAHSAGDRAGAEKSAFALAQ